jgi:probable F420-dependent oxidoreductase
VAPLLSVTLPNFGDLLPAGEWRRYLDLARTAEDQGIGRIVTVDHVVMGPGIDASRSGPFPGASIPGPWLEPLTMLSAVAAVTSRIRLATGVLIAPLRGAAVLAKTAATLDVISQGRLDLGVGVGRQREEYDAAGLAWARRGTLLDDTLAACKALWTTSPTTLHLPTVRLEEVWCEPKPVQPGGVPLWIGGTLHERNLTRLTRWGDGWIPAMGESVQGVTAGVALARKSWEDAGRDPATLRIQATLPMGKDPSGRPDLARSIEAVPALQAAGATVINVHITPFLGDLRNAERVFRDLVGRFAGWTR